MERKIKSSLINWKQNKNRKPLIIDGARQVGKTYIALSFGKEFYKNTVYFNFENSKELQKIFDKDLEPERIVKELSIFSGQSIFKNDTLIIFDEIQSCERALTSLKYFYENEPDYQIIAAGSLLGVALNREKYSFPVGKVDMMKMFPLDFEEFLWALNRKDLSESIRNHFKSDEMFSLHEIAIEYYKKYLVIGGMPRVILDFLETEDFNFVLASQKTINDSYIADMAKYASPMETIRILNAFNTIPSQLAKENKKFQYKLIKSGARAHEYEVPIEWLISSGIVNRCIKVNEGKLPLKAYCEPSSFKLYLGDSGLLCSKLEIPANLIINGNPKFNEFRGALTENYVCNALSSNNHSLYYLERNSNMEIDFIIQDKEGNIIPIEVKAGENVKANSLNSFIRLYDPLYSIRISSKNFGFENNIKSVPLYAVFCI
ncbi:AAA family ATPase [uncultured Cetobacterium sp.]|uniref:ATP-binding protein n=1 Tax=uncultured Cetobacterium sp. TaxID=527638 RepID=UPI0025D52FF6|nr:AAA family ATPase [uncultured Cetobacterium sp.]